MGKLEPISGGGHKEKSFEDEEGAAGIAGEFPHQSCGTCVWADSRDEERLGGREEPHQATKGCDLVLDQVLSCSG